MLDTADRTAQKRPLLPTVAKWAGFLAIPLVVDWWMAPSPLNLLYPLILPLSSSGFVAMLAAPAAGVFLAGQAGLLSHEVAGPVFLSLQFLLAFLCSRRGALLERSAAVPFLAKLLTSHARGVRRFFLLGATLVTLALLFRSVPLLETALWAGFLATFAHALPKPAGQPLWRRRWAELALFAGTSVVCLIALEGVARICLDAGTVHIPELYDPHPEYYRTLRLDAKTRYAVEVRQGETIPVIHRTSPQGLRDRPYGPKEEDEFRILLLGDSFTMGYATSRQDSLSCVLDRALRGYPTTKRISVINAGVAGYGPWQERGFLRERGFALQPDLVILQLYLSNDIEDTLAKIHKGVRAYHPFRAQERVREWNNLRGSVRADLFLQKHSRLYQYLLERTGGTWRISDLLDNIRFFMKEEIPPLPPPEPRPFSIEVNLEQYYPELEEGWRMLEEDVRGIQADCAGRGIGFAAYAVPSLPTMDDTFWNTWSTPRDGRYVYEDGMDVRALDFLPGFAERFPWWAELWTSPIDGRYAYEQHKDVELPEHFFQDESIPYIRIVDALKQHPVNEVYYAWDWHLTPLGHEVVAGEIIRFLRKEGSPYRPLFEDLQEDTPSSGPAPPTP